MSKTHREKIDFSVSGTTVNWMAAYLGLQNERNACHPRVNPEFDDYIS